MRIQTTTSGFVATLLIATGPALAQPGAPATAPPTAFVPTPAPAPTFAPAPAPAPVATPVVPGIAPTGPRSAVPVAAGPVSGADEQPRGFIPQLSLGGAVGLLHMSSAEVGQVGQLRLALHGEFFSASDVLVERPTPPASDHDTRLQGALTFGVTPIHHFELFGAVLASDNRNRRPFPETDRTDPEVIKSLGDLILGAKGAYPVGAGFSAGGELGVRMMSSITGLSSSPDSTSL